ncbi:MAG: CoA-binding protein [Xanthomonadaceae bacterium]|nr:CoA-binding protein [Xanthomonadaceae bacterium]
MDLAVIVIPGKAIPGILKECGEAGIHHAIIITAGYGEIGQEGLTLQQELLDIARKYNIRFLGPNCIGIVNAPIGLNTTWFPNNYRAGKVGIISQSGSYVTQTLTYFEKLGLGLSQAISIGNQADIDMVDCLEYLGEDEQTRAIALYIEGIKRPKAFLQAARKITAQKPVVAVYVGGSEAGARACGSHTASMAGPDGIYNGFFHQAGILRAVNITELFDWSLALAQQPLPSGKNIAIVTNSGGPGSSMADEANHCGLHVPLLSQTIQDTIKAITPATAAALNPVDITMNYDVELIYKKLPELLLKLPEIDGLLFYGIFGSIHFQDKIAFTGSSAGNMLNPMKYLLEKTCDEFVKLPEKLKKPILCACFSGREDDAVVRIQDGGIPVYPTPERAARAMAVLWEYATIKKRNRHESNKGENR